MSRTGTETSKIAMVVGHRYVILRYLREEPWGELWLAQDRLLGVDVGLKLIERGAPEFDAAREIMAREAVLALKLRSNLILGVFHGGQADEGFYLVQEPFPGESLLSQFQQRRHFSAAHSLHLLEQVAEALAHAHAQGVVHQSLSPLQVLVAGEEVRLANFTYPVLENNSQVSYLELRAYTPPEVLQGEPLTPAGNVFSLGVLGFRLLAGSLPYPLTFDEPFPYRLDSLPPDLEEVPFPLQNLLLRCLAADPQDRFPEAGFFLAVLQEQLDSLRARPQESWGVGPGPAHGGRTAAMRLKAWWEQGKALAGQHWQRLQERREEAPPRSSRLWWGLGLTGLAVVLVLAGAYVLRPKKAKPLLEVPAAPVTQPAPGSPPLTQPEGPPRGREPAPSAPRAAAPPPAPSSPPARTERYLVVADSYTKLDQARTLRQRLRARKFSAEIGKDTSGRKTKYQVVLGPYTDEKKAEEMVRRLKKEMGLPKPKVTPAPAAKPSASRKPR